MIFIAVSPQNMSIARFVYRSHMSYDQYSHNKNKKTLAGKENLPNLIDGYQSMKRGRCVGSLSWT